MHAVKQFSLRANALHITNRVIARGTENTTDNSNGTCKGGRKEEREGGRMGRSEKFLNQMQKALA